METVHYLSSVYEWIDMFKHCRRSVTDSECFGCPSSATYNDKQEEARARILKDRMAIRHMAFNTKCAFNSA
jgi:hypothetical protein